MKETKESVSTSECTLQCACMCACVFVLMCVSEMNSLWPGRINSLPDWLQLSRNVTGELERDLIAIRELPPSSQGRSTANFHLYVNTNRSVPDQAESYSSLRECLTGVQEKGVDQPGGQLNLIIIHTINRVQCS